MGVPAERRASNIAFRFMFGGVTGIFAGLVIERVLSAHPGATGYGILHLFAALCLMISMVILGFATEPEQAVEEEPPERQSIRESFVHFYRPGEFQRSRICFTIAVLLVHAFLLMPPFYATHLLVKLGQGSRYLGVLAMWQMGGWALGNLCAAFVGDRWGGRATLGFGYTVLAMACIAALFVETPLQAQLAYAFTGSVR